MLRRQVLKSAVAAAFAGGIASQVVASVPLVSKRSISLDWSDELPSEDAKQWFDPVLFEPFLWNKF